MKSSYNFYRTHGNGKKVNSKFQKAKGNTMKMFETMDWAMLRKQKMTLIDTVERLDDESTEKDYEDLQGIICLIDAVQDAGVDGGYATKKEVFNHPEVREACHDADTETRIFQCVGGEGTGVARLITSKETEGAIVIDDLDSVDIDDVEPGAHDRDRVDRMWDSQPEPTPHNFSDNRF